MLDRTMGKLVPLSAEQLQEIERMLREGTWTRETIEIFKAEIQSKPEDETDKGLLALCELALKGLDFTPPYVHAGPWQPIDTAPKDGTLVLLLIGADDAREHPLEDTAEGSRTIGQNNFVNDGEDRWQFAGWCWEHDHYTEGEGAPTHWQPLAPALISHGGDS